MRNLLNTIMNHNKPVAPGKGLQTFDKQGLLLGEASGEKIYLDLFNNAPCQPKNKNILITGSAGVGLTYHLLTLLKRMHGDSIKTGVITSESGIEQKSLCRALKGNYYNVNSSSSDFINIMELAVQGSDKTFKNIFDEKVVCISKFFAIICPTLDDTIRKDVESCIVQTYKNKGIDSDVPDSIYRDLTHSEFKEMPILEDVYNELKARVNDQFENLITALEPYVYGELKYFNHQTNIETNSNYMTLNLNGCSEHSYPITLFVAIDFLKGHLSGDNALVLDRLWKVDGTLENTGITSSITELMKEFTQAGGMTVCVLYSSYIADTDNAKEIIDLYGVKMIYRIDDLILNSVASKLGVKHDDVEKIAKSNRGQYLCLFEGVSIMVDLKTSAEEHNTITHSQNYFRSRVGGEAPERENN